MADSRTIAEQAADVLRNMGRGSTPSNTNSGNRNSAGAAPSNTSGSNSTPSGQGGRGAVDQTAMDFLNGVSFGDAPAAPRYIGVPNDYRTAPVQPTSFNYTQSVPAWDSRGPQYKEGQEFTILGNMSEVQRQRVQQAMINAGLLDPSRVRFGLVDPYTVKAFESVLGQANLQGASWSQMLFSSQGAESLGALGGGGGGGGGRAPLTTRVTSPATLRRLFRQAMVDMAGSKVEGFDIDAAVSAYQSAEAAYQQQAYGMAESGGTLTEPPDAQTFIADQLDAKAGTQVQANSIAERAGQLLGMLDGGI